MTWSATVPYADVLVAASGHGVAPPGAGVPAPETGLSDRDLSGWSLSGWGLSVWDFAGWDASGWDGSPAAWVDGHELSTGASTCRVTGSEVADPVPLSPETSARNSTPSMSAPAVTSSSAPPAPCSSDHAPSCPREVCQRTVIWTPAAVSGLYFAVNFTFSPA